MHVVTRFPTMSSTDLLISTQAQDDWRQILHYTWQTWGETQRDTYDEVIWNALEHIRRFPEIGHPAPGRSGEREYVLRHHTIAYQFDAQVNAVTILRIISNRRRRPR
jgi:toxin ParE1/3/4